MKICQIISIYQTILLPSSCSLSVGKRDAENDSNYSSLILLYDNSSLILLFLIAQTHAKPSK